MSEWGHDFRPEYSRLYELGALLPKCPVMAVTATATPRTREDIRRRLCLRDCLALITSVDRSNFSYAVRPKVEGAAASIARELRADESARVFAPATSEGWDVGAQLAARGGRCAGYHAKMDADARLRVHSDFLADRLRVVVATLAFGMGIDKPDIRLVVHWGATKTVEGYVQQSGRAGRDGDAARCVLFVAPQDWPRLERIACDGRQADADARAKTALRAMRAYCEAGQCRREFLLRFFGEEPEAACGRCDVCLRATAGAGEREDISASARLLLACLRECGTRCGVSTVVATLRGAPPSGQPWLRAKPSCGTGASTAATEWKRVATECQAAGLLEYVEATSAAGYAYSAVALTAEGQAWLDDPSSALARLREDDAAADRGGGRKRSHGAMSEAMDAAEEALYLRLSETRREVAAGLPPYLVCSNATLREMVRARPRSVDELRRVNGMGEKKVSNYGAAFLAALARA